MNTLLIIQIFITLALIGVILLQRSEGGALGMGGGNSGGSMFTARGSANLLTRVTAVLAALFMGNCLFMTVLTSHSIKTQTKIVSQQTPDNK
jgi:preprotein translocase subunit SecG